MNVILIDDEEVALNALHRRVDWKKHGFHNVFTVNSAQQAQEIFQSHIIGVMISDIEMPGGSGLDLFEWVKTYYPAVECVFVTCHPEFEYMRKAMQLGSADYILKPIDYEELDEILSRLVERVRHRRRTEAIPPEVMSYATDERDEREKQDVVGTVERYVREHINEDIYIADIAKQVCLNEQYLMRTFKKTTGISILEFITNERVWLAKELLANTDHPVKQVADNVGYGNYSYFTKLFKRNTGMTPQAYRRAHGGDVGKDNDSSKGGTDGLSKQAGK